LYNFSGFVFVIVTPTRLVPLGVISVNAFHSSELNLVLEWIKTSLGYFLLISLYEFNACESNDFASRGFKWNSLFLGLYQGPTSPLNRFYSFLCGTCPVRDKMLVEKMPVTSSVVSLGTIYVDDISSLTGRGMRRDTVFSTNIKSLTGLNRHVAGRILWFHTKESRT
jgi:hypothetical protein